MQRHRRGYFLPGEPRGGGLISGGGPHVAVSQGVLAAPLLTNLVISAGTWRHGGRRCRRRAMRALAEPKLIAGRTNRQLLAAGSFHPGRSKSAAASGGLVSVVLRVRRALNFKRRLSTRTTIGWNCSPIVDHRFANGLRSTVS